MKQQEKEETVKTARNSTEHAMKPIKRGPVMDGTVIIPILNPHH